MNIHIPTKDDLLRMITKEEEIRWSKWYQDQCDNVKDEVNGWLRISEQVQYQVVKDFGFTSDIEADIAVNYLRRARYIYPEEDKFKTIPVYVRNNKAKQCNFAAGDSVPNVNICFKSGEPINLYNIMDKSKLNIIIGSSHT
jgi:hypothetical protein